jgi:hypothetical protein
MPEPPKGPEVPGWMWFVTGLLTGGLAFYIWLVWYFRDVMR